MADAVTITTTGGADTGATTTAMTDAAKTTTTDTTAATTTADTSKTDAAKTSVASETAKTDDKKTTDAPVAFDAKAVKVPDGTKLDEKSVEAFAGLLNDAKLSPQERGQKLIDMHNSALKAASDASTAAWADTTTKWVNEIKADTKIGGDKLPATVATIAKAIDSLGAESALAFRQALDVTGAGNNPAVVRALYHFATLLTEGKPVVGAPPSGKPGTAELFFPNSPEMKGTA